MRTLAGTLGLGALLCASPAGAQAAAEPSAPIQAQQTPPQQTPTQPAPPATTPAPAEETPTAPSEETPAKDAPAETEQAPESADAAGPAGEAAAAETTAEAASSSAADSSAGESSAEQSAPAEQPPAEAASAEAAPAARSATARPAQAEPEPAEDAELKPDEEKKTGIASRFFLGVTLDLSVPVGNTAGFIGSAGLQGFSVDVRYRITDRLSAGVGAGFDGLSKKYDGTFVWDNMIINGVHTRQQNFTPLLGKLAYAFPGQGVLTPYVAAGFGAARSAQRILVGYTTLVSDSWHMALVPEAGVHVNVAKVTLIGDVRFNYLPGTQRMDSQTFVNVSFGVAIQ